MARMVTTVQVDAELYNRLADLRGAVSLELRFSERSLGLAPMLGLLLDHWKDNPPTNEWLRERAKLYPRRGRPPKHIVGSPLTDPNAKKKLLGHEIFERRRDANAPHHLFRCKNCTMLWATWDFPSPPARCPLRDGSVISIYSPKVYTKSELLADGFEADEVEWAT